MSNKDIETNINENTEKSETPKKKNIVHERCSYLVFFLGRPVCFFGGCGSFFISFSIRRMASDASREKTAAIWTRALTESLVWACSMKEIYVSESPERPAS